jgi:hypothetical protein
MLKIMSEYLIYYCLKYKILSISYNCGTTVKLAATGLIKIRRNFHLVTSWLNILLGKEGKPSALFSLSCPLDKAFFTTTFLLPTLLLFQF